MLPIPLVIFRLDSSKNIGSGHLQRCVTLANYLKTKGVGSIFICKNLEGNFNHIIAKENYPLRYISTDLNESDDALETLKIVEQHKNLIALVIDHYHLSLQFESIIKRAGIKIMVIDDLMNRRHECDILLDQNYKTSYESAYQDLVPSTTKKFFGPSYALLRPQFFERQPKASDKKKELKNILVFFGGSDSTGETLKFIKSLKSTKHVFHILISKGNFFLNEILSFKEHPQLKLHIEPENIAEIMEKCDFYIGSGGTITWERMCMKLSGIVITVANNQVPGAEALAKDHLQFYMGAKEEVDYSKVIDKLTKLEENSLELINEQIIHFKKIFSKTHIDELLNAIV